MIRFDDLDNIVGCEKERLTSYSEYVIRLHLMAYSVYEQIYVTKRNWTLLKKIEWGYQGLLRYELVKEILHRDPYGIRNLPPAELPALQNLVKAQVDAFCGLDTTEGLPFDTEGVPQYENFEHLLNELMVIDREAVRPAEDDKEWRERNEHSITAIFERYFHSIFIDIGEQRIIVEPSKFKEETYRTYSGYHIFEFLIDYQFFHADPLFFVLAVEALEKWKSSSDVLVYNAGTGSIFHYLKGNDPENVYRAIEVQCRNVCETFLCEMNLWSLGDYVHEWLISETSTLLDAIDPPADSSFDLILGLVTEHEPIGNESLEKRTFRFASHQGDITNRIVEQLLSKAADNSALQLVVPEQFLYSKQARLMRENCFEKDWFTKILECPRERLGNLIGKSAIVAMEFERQTNQNQVLFGSVDSQILKTREAIRANNSDLDLRPGRFLNSIEFKYRNELELFEPSYLNDADRRNDLLEIVTALEESTGFQYLFNPARSILEAFCSKIIELQPKLIPKEIHNNKVGVNLTNTLKFLSGQIVWIDNKKHKSSVTIFPRHISVCLSTCKGLGDSGSHYYTTPLGPNAYKSAVFALLEVINWMKSYLENQEASLR